MQCQLFAGKRDTIILYVLAQNRAEMEFQMIFAFINPLLYCILTGSAWASFFHKRFTQSLPPAFFTQILITLLCGLTIQKLSISLYIGIALALLALAAGLFRSKRRDSSFTLKVFIEEQWHSGLFLFILFYVFCFVSNHGKRFYSWDEVSHWGRFLKESLRMDKLYCMTPFHLSHKDYVPAVTLFEYIWCRLCRRFVEADVYRAIQVLMFSMLLPIFDKVLLRSREKISAARQTASAGFFTKIPVLFSCLLVMLIPLIFNTSNAFTFYHSIYCDYIIGIQLFYCMFAAYTEAPDTRYQLLVLTLGLNTLVLTKMSAMAMLPMVIAFFFVKKIWFSEKKATPASIAGIFIPLALPVVLWKIFNNFVDIYVPNEGNIQSYDGMHFSDILEVFSDPAGSSISYLGEVRSAFVHALVEEDILLHGSYVAVLILLVGITVLLALLQKGLARRKTGLMALWIFLAGVAHALLMYFLYATSFEEEEAVRLASYTRYMNTYIVAAVLLIAAIYFSTDIWEKYHNHYVIATAFAAYLVVFHASAFKQILPGSIAGDYKKIAAMEESANVIIENTPEEARVFIVTRGDDASYPVYLRFYANPRPIYGASYGPAVDENDTSSLNVPAETFFDSAKNYEYLFLNVIDDAFIQTYAEVFADPSLLENHALYKITSIEGDKLHLEKIYG